MRKPVTQTKTCACGCNTTFEARRSYRVLDADGRPTFPDYMRGHHPNCVKNHTTYKTPWNRGLQKGDHPSLERMGFQNGHPCFSDWSHLHERQRNDAAYRERWLAAKREQVPWNKGLTRGQYPNGIATGPEHGNWVGGHGWIRNTTKYREFRITILERDNYTCVQCGDRNRKGRGSRIQLEVDHIEPVCLAPDRIFDPTNARVLCAACHRATDTFGSKARYYVRKRRQNQGGSP